MQIELIPGFSNPNIKTRLEKLFTECVTFKGTTAFWTIDVNFFEHQSFVNAIQKPASFFCTDIQLPTNIKNLLEFHDKGAKEIYLHHYRQHPSQYTQNTNLLHSKVLLFEMEDGKVEIWIGSHNFTGFAIKGLNLEASASIKCNKDDSIFSQVNDYLEYVRHDFCTKFDPAKVDIYEQLQSRDAIKVDNDISLTKVITIVGEDMGRLVEEEIIQLLSLNHKEYTKFKTVDDEIYLHTLDLQTKKEHVYKCKVEQTSNLNESVNKLSVNFTEPRRLAFIGTKLPPYLRKSAKVGQIELSKAKFFVAISIQYEIEKFEVYKKPKGDDFSYWKTTSKNPYARRLGIQSFNHNESKDFKIQEASFDRKVSKTKVDLKSDWLKDGDKLNGFYRELDNILKREGQQLAEEVSIDYYNNTIELLLNNIKIHGHLSEYSKILIDRIIIDLSKSTSL
jgi:hypothetical protein